MKKILYKRLEKRSTEILVLSAAFLIIATFTAASDVLDAGGSSDLVAEYRFDTGTGNTAYDTAGNNDGTLNNFDYTASSGWLTQSSQSVVGEYPQFEGWSDQRTYTCGDTEMMGGYENFGSSASTSKTLNLPKGQYRVSFNYYFGDSWDGESGKFFWNDKEVWSKSSTTGGKDLCGRGWGESETILNDKFTTSISHEGGEAILRFDSTLDQNANDEWWGVDNIEVKKIGAKRGSGVKLDGNDDYVDTSIGTFSSDGNWAVSFWFKTDDPSKLTHLTGVPSQHSNGWTPLSHFATRNSRLAWWDTNGWRSGSTTLKSDTWYHASLVGDNGEVKMYLDGQLENSETSNIQNNIGRFTNIGRRQHNDDRYFDGLIDNFKVYDQSLNGSQLKSVANQGSVNFEQKKGLPSNKILDMSFSEKSSTQVLDTSGYENHGDISGSVKQETAGGCKVGRCYVFDGSSGTGIDLNDIWSNHTRSRTFMFWFKEAESGAGSNDRIISQDCSEWFCFNDYGSNTIRIYYDGASNYDFNLDQDKWHHAALDFDESAANLTVYIDGEVQEELSYSSSWSHLSRPVVLGGNTEGTDDISGGHWEGRIDNLKVFNQSLSQQEIIDNTQGLKGSGSTLDMRFDSGGGDHVVDYSVHSNHGNSYNGVNWSKGVKGKALSFDGIDDMTLVSDTESLKYKGEGMTISGWYYETGDSNGKIVSKPWNGGGDYNYRVGKASTDKLNLHVEGNNTNIGLQSGQIEVGEWHHFTAVLNEPEFELYVDGELENSKTQSFSSWVPSDNGDGDRRLTLGSLYPYGEWSGDTGFSYEGKLDNLKILPFAASRSKVKELYAQGKSQFGSTETQKSAISDSLVLSQTFDRIETCGQSDTVSCPSGVSGEVAVDESGEANHGELVNGPSVKSSGDCRVGGCVQFDESGYIHIPVDNPPTGNQERTLTAWARLDSGTDTAQDQDIVGWGRQNTAEMNAITYGLGSSYCWGYWGYGGTYDLWQKDDGCSSNYIKEDKWYHITAKYNGSKQYIYINGKLRNTASVDLSTTSTDIYIGKTPDRGANLDGSVDQVRLYNRSLSDEEVWNLYTNGRDRESGMAGSKVRWKFDDVPEPGDGTDGSITVSSQGIIVNDYTFISENTSGRTIDVNDTSGFSAGDEVLIFQMQDGLTDCEAGSYEYVDISSVGGGEITLSQSLRNDYCFLDPEITDPLNGPYNPSSGDHKASVAQVVRVPQYQDVTVNSGASITAPYWNGVKGGIVAFKASGTVDTQGKINVKARGFRGGGAYATGNHDDGGQGEGLEGWGIQGSIDGCDGRYAPNGIGGGGSGTPYNDGGDPGAGGGYGTSGSDAGQSNVCNLPLAGGTEGSRKLPKMFFGGGGGGGSDSDDADCDQGIFDGLDSGYYCQRGGHGGGIVKITANRIINANISADGHTTYPVYDGGPGGGAGGTIWLKTSYLDAENLTANGGPQVCDQKSNGDDCGGSGGEGRVRIDYLNSYSGQTSPSPYTGADALYDYSGNRMIGNIKADTRPVSGKIGKALSFDGSDDHFSAEVEDLDNQEGTISMWVRPAGWNGGDGSYQGLLQTESPGSWSNNAGQMTLIGQWGSNNDLYFRLVNDNGCCGDDDIQISASDFWKEGRWTHITATWSGSRSEMKLYVNGKLEGSLNSWAAPSTSINSKIRMAIGHDKYFNGDIDDVRIYPYALNQEQVKKVMNGGGVSVS